MGTCGGSSGGSTEGENAWGSQEEEGEGRAVVEGPGSSEERSKVEDWESKVLGSESAKEAKRKGHSGTLVPGQWAQTVEGRSFHSSQKQKWVNQTAPHCPSKATLSEGS